MKKLIFPIFLLLLALLYWRECTPKTLYRDDRFVIKTISLMSYHFAAPKIIYKTDSVHYEMDLAGLGYREIPQEYINQIFVKHKGKGVYQFTFTTTRTDHYKTQKLEIDFDQVIKKHRNKK